YKMKKKSIDSSTLAKLLASKIVAKNLADNIADFAAVRTNWTPEFAAALDTRVDTAANELIGKVSTTALFESTAKLLKLIEPARRDISALKVQMKVDFEPDPVRLKLMLDELGYTAYFKKVSDKNQKAIIGLLTSYKRNVSKYKADMVAKGTPAALIDGISAYATTVEDANTLQEQLKTICKNATAEKKAKLNEVYKEIANICKIAANHYIGNPEKKAMFTFSKVLANLGLDASEEKEPPTPKS
ncbi:MAG TPA: hypothetical protein VHO90_02410, partial [Bacteroidales bacterium]|nr:hypothetical protein [Bacteroidales bacterium]